jgi:hypothetical protein
VNAQEQSAAMEQAGIEKKRQQLQAGFVLADAACRQKFAVNNCLNGINTKRQEAMADLRRREISLNDDERKKRGAEQVRRVEEKLSAFNSQESIDRRAQMRSEYETRDNRESEVRKAKEKRSQAKNRLSDSPANARKRKKQLSMEEKASSDAEKADRHLDRQNQVRERRIKYEALTSKQPLSKAKPLPIPP